MGRPYPVLFHDEVARNAAVYEDVSPVLGVEITEAPDLGGGVRLAPASTDIISGLDYKARSDAVHSGVLPSKSKIDLDVADQLVVRVVQAILVRGKFPDWASLTIGEQG